MRYLILLLISSSAFAGDILLNIHLGSNHVGAPEGMYNERNLGAGLGYQLKSVLELRAGAYNNSHDSTSVYGGAILHTSHRRYISAGLNAGIVTGYANLPISLYALPTLFINTTKKLRLEFSYMPKGMVSEYAVLTGSMGVRF